MMNEEFKGVTLEDMLPYVREGLTCEGVARKYNRGRYALTAYLKKEYNMSFMDLQVMVQKEKQER